MKIVEVTWTDIEELAGGWHDQEDVDRFISENRSRTVKHVGYLYEEDEKYIVLVDSLAGDEFGTLNIIPRGCIEEIKELKTA
jgi:hypothetical protein